MGPSPEGPAASNFRRDVGVLIFLLFRQMQDDLFVDVEVACVEGRKAVRGGRGGMRGWVGGGVDEWVQWGRGS